MIFSQTRVLKRPHISSSHVYVMREFSGFRTYDLVLLRSDANSKNV